jgi:riboflavin kinase / FMN adenylyltransferase
VKPAGVERTRLSPAAQVSPVNFDNVQRWDGLDDIPADYGPCVVTIGVFDCVHQGHATLICRAVAAARTRGVPCVVMTFDPHPLAVLAPAYAPVLLGSVARRIDLLGDIGVDATLVMPFTPELAAVEAAAFIREILVQRLHAELVVVGQNFTFGRGGLGTVETLTQVGAATGMDVDAVELLGVGTGVVSATRIRALLADGEVEQVADLLGHPFRADGVVVRGEQRGRGLGYPTANLDMAPDAAVPADGVYAGVVLRLAPDGSQAGATRLGVGAISVGTNPTFDGQHRTVEAFILDFDADLYGDVLGVEFAHRLRGMVRFDSIDALIAQMDADVAQARELVT